jgi:hypothetical protein
MIIPLKQKYRVAKPKGNASKSNSSIPKKKTIWALLEASARSGKHRRSA